MLFLLFEKPANLRIILYKECNKSDVTEQSANWDTCAYIKGGETAIAAAINV